MFVCFTESVAVRRAYFMYNIISCLVDCACLREICTASSLPGGQRRLSRVCVSLTGAADGKVQAWQCGSCSVKSCSSSFFVSAHPPTTTPPRCPHIHFSSLSPRTFGVKVQKNQKKYKNPSRLSPSRLHPPSPKALRDQGFKHTTCESTIARPLCAAALTEPISASLIRSF